MPILNVDNLADFGIISDLQPSQLPPNAWTSGRNVRFDDMQVFKSEGWIEFVDPGTTWDGGVAGQVYYAIPYNDGTDALWVFCGLKDVVVTDGVTEKEITNVSADYTGDADDIWTGGILSSNLILNNGKDKPQFWTGNFATPTKLTDLTDFGNHAAACASLRVYKNYLVALDVTKGSTRYKSLVKWSDSAALGQVPQSWDADDQTTDAGETDLSERTKDVGVGALIDCLPLRDVNVLYTDSQVWLMQFIGGQYVFNFQQLFKNVGILARRCVAEFEGKHFCVGLNDVYVHDGSSFQSVIDRKRRRFLYADIHPDYYNRTYVFANYPANEMWICYVADGSPNNLPNKALVWNWRSGAWGEVSLPDNTPHISSGIVITANPLTWDTLSGTWDAWAYGGRWDMTDSSREQSPLICSDKLYKGDEGNTMDGTNMVSSVERVNIPIGTQDQFVRIKALYPRMTGDASVLIYVGAHMAPGDSPDYQAPVEFTPGVDQKVDVRVTGTHMALKVQSSGDQRWSMSGYEVEFEPVSRR